MGVFNNKTRKNVQQSRKQQRKNKRREKKTRKNEFFSKKRQPGQYVINPDKSEDSIEVQYEDDTVEKPNPLIKNKKEKSIKISKVPTTEEIRKKEFKEQKKLEKEMVKKRNKQLFEANKEEDRIIKQLEKHLGLKKRKSKALPKSFAEDGLDYLLEACDPIKMKNAVIAEQGLNDNSDIGEDFELITGKSSRTKDTSEEYDSNGNNFISDSECNSSAEENDKYEELNDISNSENESEFDMKPSLKNIDQEPKGKKRKKHSKKSIQNEEEIVPDLQDYNDDSDEFNHSDDEFETDDDEQNNTTKKIKGAVRVNEDGTWEDIYGRERGKDGTVLTGKEATKYIPPALREKISGNTENVKVTEKLRRLRKQLKGFLNRLAESNMHSIATQIEELYMNNSRNDMNETLTNLMLESLVSEVITPERLLIEHILLISILHANVGTEVGAHFLQTIIKQFNIYCKMDCDVENKILDNLVMIIAQMYNFKIFDTKLMYEILSVFAENFDEKSIECILHILRSVGFTLRKDDPLALKNMILDLQKRAANVSVEDKGYSRIKFMLEIVLAVKNNNMAKIPNYDTSYSEHLKKVIKGLIRKGNYITQLNISLEDLLKADERGKWWVVGSAWTGNDESNDRQEKTGMEFKKYSGKLLELAKKQRMNTETRKNVFCVIMSAEDYLDAFEKLLKLGLKNQQEREIINVILHCCLQEKKYNPYYAHLAQKFCDYDRKYQMIIKYSVWDKLKALNEHSGSQISNLAKMLIHLFVEKGLPISTLKIVQFSELDKTTVRFIRQVLIGIILHEDGETCLAVFAKVSNSDKLKMFRDSLKLFIHHFLLKNLKSDSIPEEQKNLLEKRIKLIEKVLAKQHKI